MSPFVEDLRRIYGLPDESCGIERRNGSIFRPSNVFTKSGETAGQAHTRQATPAQIEAVIQQGKDNQTQ